ncbi:MAG TPA: hypothetical protein VG755_04930 [Nannocystaceae bacterium]|nr:hypothetical protein [Nannocystaceae bacterium]
MPRPAPPPIDRVPSERFADVASYWAEPWAEAALAAEKYRAMSDALAASAADGKAMLAAIARRFPGALREAQITRPEVYRARVVASGRPGPRPRSAWADEGLAAVPLWSDLHGLLGDVARMRAQPDAPLCGLAASRRAWWPIRLEAWPGWVVRRFDPGLAHAWLAALAGLDPHELDLALRR